MPKIAKPPVPDGTSLDAACVDTGRCLFRTDTTERITGAVPATAAPAPERTGRANELE